MKKEDLRNMNLFLFDMDGTLLLGNQLFDFTKELLETIRKEGKKYLIMTNNSSKSVSDYVKRLAAFDIPVTEEDFLTSSQAMAYYLLKNHPGKKLYVCGTMALKEELQKAGYRTLNAHKSFYVIEPEYNANSQIIFRDNIQPMIRNKHVLVLMASCTTGYTAKKGIETIGYYGGRVVGVAALYSMTDEVCGQTVHSVFSKNDLPDYESYDYKDCPYCKQGKRLDALVNSHGYSWL